VASYGIGQAARKLVGYVAGSVPVVIVTKLYCFVFPILHGEHDFITFPPPLHNSYTGLWHTAVKQEKARRHSEV
jgi:hypothetical protein